MRLATHFWRLCLVAALLWATQASAIWPFGSSASYEARETERTAQLLLRAHRYNEAVHLLRTELDTQPVGKWRFQLTMMLAEGQVGLGDSPGLAATLAQAEAIARKPSQLRDIQRYRKRLEELRAMPALAPVTADSSRAAAALMDTTTSGADETLLRVLVTNSFFETDLRQVLSDLATQTGTPIVWDPTVKGLVTYEAKEQPLDKVLEAILLSAGFGYAYRGGIVYVGSTSPNDASFCLISRTEVVTLANTDATDAIAQLSEYFQPYVRASKISNTVTVTAPAATVSRILSDLKQLDKPPAQIMIEVVICEFSQDALRQMGLDWSLTRTEGRNPSWQVGAQHTDIANPSLTGSYTDIGYKIGNYTADLTASLEALVESGQAEIRAKPRITTLNGRPAQISLTTDQYFVIQTGGSQLYQYNTLQAVSSGIKLEITPYVSSTSDEITLYVKPEVGDVVGSGVQGLPQINKRAASTSVRVHDGETFTVGGLNLQRQQTLQRKIPFLGDIPLLGYLFRYDERKFKDTEIIIFVTPHLLAR